MLALLARQNIYDGLSACPISLRPRLETGRAKLCLFVDAWIDKSSECSTVVDCYMAIIVTPMFSVFFWMQLTSVLLNVQCWIRHVSYNSIQQKSRKRVCDGIRSTHPNCRVSAYGRSISKFGTSTDYGTGTYRLGTQAVSDENVGENVRTESEISKGAKE